MFTFENKGAFIVGAGRNIGRVIALEFARGFDVRESGSLSSSEGNPG